MPDLSVGQKYVHNEEGFQVTITGIKKKILGTTQSIEKVLISFTRDDDGSKMLTEKTVFSKNYTPV